MLFVRAHVYLERARICKACGDGELLGTDRISSRMLLVVFTFLRPFPSSLPFPSFSRTDPLPGRFYRFHLFPSFLPRFLFVLVFEGVPVSLLIPNRPWQEA